MPVTSLRKACVRPPEVAKVRAAPGLAQLPLAASEVEHADTKIKIKIKICISMNGDAVLQDGADRVALIAPRTMNR
ncbi:hypothetical protein I5P84_14405 [Pseudomonas mosselii]|uniref:hypothetical protein n=1 Tax=Pseudomonas mosselii TaxID=78327 RepID=UPI0018D6FE4A|nr:hypothetical protein [Pseudomonas mosselii]MBH3310626.1 hypothetical protein [Pseudomonas mosselii]MBH3325736.1 hypothetical protein [Pseudomonas mosselii]